MGLRSRPIFRNRHFTFVFPPRNMTGMNHLAYQMHVQHGSATAYITNGMLLSSCALYLHAKRCFGTIHHTGDAQKSSLRSENQWFGDRGVQGLFWYTSCDGYLGLKGTIGTWVCLEIQKQLLSESFNCQTRRPIPILLGTPKSYILASISTPMISHYITMCFRLVRFVPIYATFFRPRQTYYQSWKPGQKVARFHARTSWGVRRWWFARARLGYRRVHGVIPGLRAHIGRTGSMVFSSDDIPATTSSRCFQRSLHGDWYPTLSERHRGTRKAARRRRKRKCWVSQQSHSHGFDQQWWHVEHGVGQFLVINALYVPSTSAYCSDVISVSCLQNETLIWSMTEWPDWTCWMIASSSILSSWGDWFDQSSCSGVGSKLLSLFTQSTSADAVVSSSPNSSVEFCVEVALFQ